MKQSQSDSAAVLARTGKDWSQWFALLDRANARAMSHKEIVAYLHDEHGVGPWWQQMITVAYEQTRGGRQKHEMPSGFQVSASRTIAVPVSKLYRAWKDEKARARWLPDPSLTVRKATPNKSLRLTWVDGKTKLDVNLYAKGDAKSQVAVEHSRLASAKAADRMKAYWAKALPALKESLEA